MERGLDFVVTFLIYDFISYREMLTSKNSFKELAIGWCAPAPAILAVLLLIFIIYFVGSAIVNMLYKTKLVYPHKHIRNTTIIVSEKNFIDKERRKVYSQERVIFSPALSEARYGMQRAVEESGGARVMQPLDTSDC